MGPWLAGKPRTVSKFWPKKFFLQDFMRYFSINDRAGEKSF